MIIHSEGEMDISEYSPMSLRLRRVIVKYLLRTSEQLKKPF